MDQDLTREQNMRKKYIELFADKLYTRFSYLFTDKIEVVKQKALDKYLNSDMTIPEITEDMVKIIEDMKKEYDRKQREAAEKKIDEMPVTAVDVQPTTNSDMPVTAQEEIVVEHQDIPVTAATIQPELDVIPTVAVGEQPIIDTIPTTAVDVQPEKDNIPNVAHINFFDQVRMVDDYSAGAISKAPARSFDKPVPNINELNNMLEEKPKEEKTENTNSLENSNQYVKTNSNNSSDGQSGSISLFNIILSILAIAGIVLVAMILNVLLK